MQHVSPKRWYPYDSKKRQNPEQQHRHMDGQLKNQIYRLYDWQFSADE
jgi:hypothetical protein